MDKLKNDKQIQIPQPLFVDLVKFFIVGDTSTRETILKGLERKIDALAKRELYTKYKTAATEEEREQARQEYLDRIGVPESFRW